MAAFRVSLVRMIAVDVAALSASDGAQPDNSKNSVIKPIMIKLRLFIFLSPFNIKILGVSGISRGECLFYATSGRLIELIPRCGGVIG